MSFPYRRVAFFATSNIHKFQEAKKILAEYNIATAMIKIKVIEIQDENLEKIAETSALDAATKCNLPVIVEDAGLFINALNGFPGPYSSYVNKTIGVEGILKLMKNVEDRTAYFFSVVAFHDPATSIMKIFHGKVEGKIAKEARGKSGFGFDPIFIPIDGDGRTFAEMKTEEKNKFSHRAKALRKFAEWYCRNGCSVS
ncbi:non-canonical purine NTP pyrophosphatase, RdgB/HAM1 family [Candidatus Bathyarchaeota archaeon]|nr:MAG: non-canonical purine NTP pyrophosphatase, RdgB/HAM1 family [Candidatus Bathyarchaeota archaeon]